MKQYMAITNDKYEFPIAAADTANELGKMLGLDEMQVYYKICHGKQAKKHRSKGYTIIRVEIEEQHDEIFNVNMSELKDICELAKIIAIRDNKTLGQVIKEISLSLKEKDYS